MFANNNNGLGTSMVQAPEEPHNDNESTAVPSLPSRPSKPSPSIPKKDVTDCENVSYEANNGDEGNDGNDGREGTNALHMPTFYSKVKGKLPIILEYIGMKSTSDADADMLLLGTIVSISSCLPNIFGIYNRRRVYPNLYLFVTARAGVGKGRLNLCKIIVEPIHYELREKAKEEGKSRRLHILPGNSSSTAIYQELSNNGGAGIIFETEGDTLTTSLGQDFGNFSDGLRKAFHHETISYLRRKDNEHVEIKEPRLSIVLSGTHSQVISLMRSVENGLFSRFLFYNLDGEVVWDDVFQATNGKPIEEYFKMLGTQYLIFYHFLVTVPPFEFQLTEEQRLVFNEHFSRLQTEYLGLFGEDTVASVRRLALSTFRIAMVISSLRIREDDKGKSTFICNDEDFQTAMSISEVLQEHMLRVIKELPASSASNNTGIIKEPLLLKTFWDELPEEFETQDALLIGSQVGLSIPTIERYLKQWQKTRLDKVIRGRYKKRKQ